MLRENILICGPGLFRDKLLPTLLALGLLGASGVSGAKIYKYVDENGNVVYSQTKPKNVEALEVKPRVRKVSPEEARKELDALGEKADNAGRNRDVIKKSKEDTEALAQREKENCETARKNLAVLQSSPRVQSPDENGQLFVLDEEAVKAKTAEAQEQITRYCK